MMLCLPVRPHRKRAGRSMVVEKATPEITMRTPYLREAMETGCVNSRELRPLTSIKPRAAQFRRHVPAWPTRRDYRTTTGAFEFDAPIDDSTNPSSKSLGRD
jgi:hypothetical protein